MKTAIVGGGAAGFFLAVNLKEMVPEMEVTIYERGQRVLAKVAVSGGGRCNCTNTFEDVGDLATVYPRGHRLMRRLMKGFGPADAWAWFERHGVRLTVQDDHCVFPATQDARTIVDCLVGAAHRQGIKICSRMRIDSMEQLEGYDFVAVTTGGSPKGEGLRWLAEMGHQMESPVPSLFTLSIADESLRQLMGTVVDGAVALIPGTGCKATGPLLVTHWGVSGPCILRLSSYAARLLAEHDYRMPLSINWTGRRETEVAEELWATAAHYPQRQVGSVRPFGLPQRLWSHLLARSISAKADCRWSELGRKDMNRLCDRLCNDGYQIAGRAPFKDEFVTCGGISLASVSASTLESRVRERLYFAGEVLDIDGVTGGFNFQAAWTTAYTVATAIRQRVAVTARA